MLFNELQDSNSGPLVLIAATLPTVTQILAVKKYLNSYCKRKKFAFHRLSSFLRDSFISTLLSSKSLTSCKVLIRCHIILFVLYKGLIRQGAFDAYNRVEIWKLSNFLQCNWLLNASNTPHLNETLSSVTRFCSISQLLRNFKRLWQFIEGLFCFGHNFDPTVEKVMQFGKVSLL